jgi:hypothetical protein
MVEIWRGVPLAEARADLPQRDHALAELICFCFGRRRAGDTDALPLQTGHDVHPPPHLSDEMQGSQEAD